MFGEVLEGYDIVDKIQNVDKQPGDKPTVKVTIEKSGELPHESGEDAPAEATGDAKTEGTVHDEI